MSHGSGHSLPRPNAKGPDIDDATLARWLAGEAGDRLLAIRHRLGHGDPATLKSAGDDSAHDLIRTELFRWRPEDAVLSEEDDGARQA